MSASGVIGALRVVIGGDTSGLTTAMAGALGLIAKFGFDIGKATIGINNTLESMDQIGKQSQKIGIPVEQLSALRLAADLSDVSMESLGKGVGKLSKALVTAAGQPTSDAANAFRALKVSVVDAETGALRPVIDVTQDIATKFEGMKDGAGKTAASMALFGKAGADLIPMLNSGGAGLQQMMQQAQSLGITFDTNTAKAAEKFRDTLTLLGAAKDGIIVKLTAHLLPALQQFADRMFAAASNTDKQNQKLSFLTTAFDGLARGILLVCDNFKLLMQLGMVFVAASFAGMVINLAVAFVGLARAIQSTGLVMAAVEAIRKISLVGWLVMAGGIAVLTGNFDAMVSKLKEVGGAVTAALPSGGEGLAKALSGLGINLSALTVDLGKMKEGTDASSKSLKDFNYSALAGKNAVDQFIDSQKKSLESTAAEVKTFGMLPGSMEAAKLQLQALAIATANHTTISAAQQLQLDLTKQKIIENGQSLAALQLIQSNLTPAQLYQQELFKIQMLYDNGKLSAAQYGTAMEQAAQRAGATWDIAGASIAGSFAKISASFGKEGSAMAKAGKVFGVIQGTISMYTGAAKALELPFPANLAAMAAVLAQGAALVAGIKGTNVPTGAVTGGAFQVPGGIGGGDKVLTQMALEPGELVEVSSNRSDGYRSGGRGGRASSGGTYTLQVPDFLRPLAEALMPHIEQANADGHTLKLVTV